MIVCAVRLVVVQPTMWLKCPSKILFARSNQDGSFEWTVVIKCGGDRTITVKLCWLITNARFTMTGPRVAEILKWGVTTVSLLVGDWVLPRLGVDHKNRLG